MPFYFMYANSGPGHQSHHENYFYAEHELSPGELEERWGDWVNERYYRNPKGSAWILTEIGPGAYNMLKEGYERDIQRATTALEALQSLPLKDSDETPT